MAKQLNDNAAFASSCVDDETLYVQKGLTKREYFSGLAMQGLLANPEYTESIPSEETCNVYARVAIQMADALLTELNKEI